MVVFEILVLTPLDWVALELGLGLGLALLPALLLEVADRGPFGLVDLVGLIGFVITPLDWGAMELGLAFGLALLPALLLEVVDMRPFGLVALAGLIGLAGPVGLVQLKLGAA